MRSQFWKIWLGISVILLLAVGLAPAAAGAAAPRKASSTIVVANRGSGSISVIDANLAALIENIDLPMAEGENFPEPMYVVYTRSGDQVLVGDRANDRVVAFDARSFAVKGMAPAGEGVFHMWADERGRQLWVNNDVDNTTTVINPMDLSVITTIPTPADLVAMGGKPHDVILDPGGKLAFVTVLGVSGENDYVVQYRTDTFMEIGRLAVGKDPHVSLTGRNNLLYVPCQGTGEVYIINRFSMQVLDVLEIPGAHGAGMAFNGRHFYTTNITGGGMQALFTIDTQTNAVIGAPVDAPYPVPHNIALTRSPDKLFLTHSGGVSDKVTFYQVSMGNPIPVYAGEITVELNPFGIVTVP